MDISHEDTKRLIFRAHQKELLSYKYKGILAWTVPMLGLILLVYMIVSNNLNANTANDKQTLLSNAIKYVTNFFESLSFENTTEVRVTDDVRYKHFVQGCVNGHNIVKYTDKTVLECQVLCTENEDCMAFEYGVAYGGRGGEYQPRDCQLQDSADRIACDGSYHNLDLYVKDDGYICGSRHCPWDYDEQGKDWGYYTRRNSNCKSCKEKCSNDSNCGGVECGGTGSYCSWWKHGLCIKASEQTSKHNRHLTCMKDIATCTCKDLVNQHGVGNCEGRKPSQFNGQYFVCYVVQPSNCSDLIDSATNPEEKFSAEACDT